jgi:hypothetical protein
VRANAVITLLYLGLLLCAVVVLALPPVAFAQEDGELLFCRDFDSQAEAQRHLREDPSDPDALDEEEGQDDDGIACKTSSYDNPDKDLEPVAEARDHPEAQSNDSPKAQSNVSPKAQSNDSPKAQQSKEAPKQQNKLMDAGGNLPAPQEGKSVSSDASRGLTLWRIGGIIVTIGIFGVAVTRLISNR